MNAGTTLIVGPSPDLMVVAEQLGAEGEKIAIMSGATARLNEYCRRLNRRSMECKTIETDVADPAAVLRGFTELGTWTARLDRLIYNVDAIMSDAVASAGMEAMHSIMSKSLFGFVNTMQLATQMFRRTHGGHSIVITRPHSMDAESNETAFIASDASLQIYVSALRRELSGIPIQITEVQIGMHPDGSGARFADQEEIVAGILRVVEERPERLTIGQTQA